MKFFTLCLLLVPMFMAGCRHQDHSHFSLGADDRTINHFTYFSVLDASCTGSTWRDPDRAAIEDASARYLHRTLRDLGYLGAGDPMESDFLVTAEWSKRLVLRPHSRRLFDRSTDRDKFFPEVCVSLQVHAKSYASGEVLWYAELRNAFTILDLSQARIEKALEDALLNFPVKHNR